MKNNTKTNNYTETNYLVSVSDMMMGLLFIFIIIMVYFASTAQKMELSAAESQKKAQKAEVAAKDAEIRAQDALKRLSNSKETRTQLLNTIKANLSTDNVEIFVDEKNGILRLPEGTVSFKHGKAEFQDEQSKENLRRIAKALAMTIPCYLQKFRTDNCVKTPHYLESLFIEGHTDTTGIDNINWELSTQRALTAYWFIINEAPALKDFTNDLEQPLLSVSGYGKCRPLKRKDGISDQIYDMMNRRIDFRFLMTQPEDYIVIKEKDNWILKRRGE